MGEQTTTTTRALPAFEARVRRAYDDGYAAAVRGEEAAPGCTTSAEGRAFLRGYIAGASARADDGNAA
jgi:ribosome modulation factor